LRVGESHRIRIETYILRKINKFDNNLKIIIILGSEQSNECIGFTMKWVFFFSLSSHFGAVRFLQHSTLIWTVSGDKLNLVGTLRVESKSIPCNFLMNQEKVKKKITEKREYLIT